MLALCKNRNLKLSCNIQLERFNLHCKQVGAKKVIASEKITSVCVSLFYGYKSISIMENSKNINILGNKFKKPSIFKPLIIFFIIFLNRLCFMQFKFQKKK